MNFKEYLENVSWIPGDPLLDKTGKPMVLYHGSNAKFSKFSIRKSTMGIIWMSSDKEKISRGESGAVGTKHIISMNVSLKKPAGWREYDQLALDQLRSMGFDGAILQDRDGSFDAFVFNPNQIKIIGVE